MNEIIGIPFPPPGGGEIIGKVIKIVKTIWDIITRKSARDAAETGAVNELSSLESIERVTEIFTEFRERVYDKAAGIEEAAGREINYYLEELKDALMENQERAARYGIRMSHIEKKINKIAARINGCIDGEISKKVSLDNAECRNIMKMIPGIKKENAMIDFLDNMTKEALSACCDELKENLAEIFDEVEEEVVGAVEKLQKQTEADLKNIASLDADNYQQTVQRVMLQSYLVSDACGLVESIFQEV